MPVRVKADVALSRSALGPSHVLLANKTQPELFIVKALFHVGSPIWEVSVAAYYGTSYGCIWISWYNGCFMKWHQPQHCTNRDTGWCWTLSLHLRAKCLRSERQRKVRRSGSSRRTYIYLPPLKGGGRDFLQIKNLVMGQDLKYNFCSLVLAQMWIDDPFNYDRGRKSRIIQLRADIEGAMLIPGAHFEAGKLQLDWRCAWMISILGFMVPFYSTVVMKSVNLLYDKVNSRVLNICVLT